MDNDENKINLEMPLDANPSNLHKEQLQQASEQIPSPAPPAKNKLLVGLCALTIGAFAALGVIAITNNSSETAPESSETTATETIQQQNLASALTLVEGSVQYATDSGDWVAAEGGETIAVGESVRTGSDSRAVILLDDGSAVRLDESSEIKLIASDANTTEVLLVNGQVYSRVIESETRVFAVVTENERFEALGTAYKTSTGSGTDTLEVYHSKVKVESDDTEIEAGNKYDTANKEKSSIDLDALKDDDFLRWNKQADESDEKYKDSLGVLGIEEPKEEPTEPEPSEEPTTAPSSPSVALSLTGSAGDKGINLSWSNTGISAGEGYKIVFSKNSSSPLYKTDSSHYVGAGKTSYALGLKDGQQYSIRVCAYRSSTGSCDSYSNTVTATAPKIEKELVQAGDVTLSIEGDQLSWSIQGTAPHGYKVVLSAEGTPIYPANSIQYLSKTSATLPEKPAGTYFVRVCKYTADSNISGGCTDYSNQVEYVVAIAEE